MENQREKTYYTYLLRCEDGSIYTGITTDLERRAAEHFSSRTNARYTRSRRAVRMEAAFRSRGRAAAARLEYRIKRLTHGEKERIIAEKALGPLASVIDAGAYTYTEPSVEAQTP